MMVCNNIKGHVLIWDLDDSALSAKIIFSAEWSSPPLNVTFCGLGQRKFAKKKKRDSGCWSMIFHSLGSS